MLATAGKHQHLGQHHQEVHQSHREADTCAEDSPKIILVFYIIATTTKEGVKSFVNTNHFQERGLLDLHNHK